MGYFVPYTVDQGYVSLFPMSLDRIYAQYRDSPKAVEWYNITHTMIGKLTPAAQIVRRMWDIDAMKGEQLNIIGRVVVQPREFTGQVSMVPGWVAAAPNEPAQCGDMSSMCSSLTVDQDSQMSDELYRLALKAKIIKNNSDATIESILEGMNLLLPTADV
ncbi:MAG: DUF2612 domain-containing protein, partial [Plesiomonas sp.]